MSDTWPEQEIFYAWAKKYGVELSHSACMELFDVYSKRRIELEQQLADTKASSDSIEATLRNQWEQTEAKLSQANKLIGECAEQVKFAVEMPRSAEAQRRLTLLNAKLQERDSHE